MPRIVLPYLVHLCCDIPCSFATRLRHIHSLPVQILRSIAAFTCCLMLLSCDRQPSTAAQALPEQAHVVAPQANLYQVDKYLFRSEQLTPNDLKLLKTHNIDAILNLRFFGRHDDHDLLEELSHEAQVSLHHQPLKSWQVTPAEVAQALFTIKRLQQQDKRVLVHCYHGADRTGLIIAMYRIIEQGWYIEDAKTEMTEGGYGYHPIWINLENMLNAQTVAAVRQQLAQRREFPLAKATHK